MIPEHIVTKEQIKAINKRFGGHLRTDAEIETALYLGHGKNVYRKIAHLWRAILVGHPFTDGNKRTALAIAYLMLEACKIKTVEKVDERLVRETRTVAMHNITEIDKIERLVRYAVTGN